ncbi:MAG: chloride channel protein [Chitinophagaceae bacterium]
MFHYIASNIKAYLNAAPNRHLKKSILNALPFWVGALLTGLVAVAYARLFGMAEAAGIYLFKKLHWYFLLVTPVTFVLAWYLVKRFAPFARGSGIPQVSAAIALSNPKDYSRVNKLLNIRLAVTKIISSVTMALGGGVIGREGPTIQISASIFKAINERLPTWYPRISRQNMIITGAAAGLASAFNTPLGGIVFAIEELTTTHFSYFKSALLTGVILAGLTALTLLGPYLYLGYPRLQGLHSGIVVGVVFVALLSGATAAVMGQAILWLTARKKQLQRRIPEWIIVALFGLLIAATAVLINPDVLGSGKESDDARVVFCRQRHQLGNAAAALFRSGDFLFIRSRGRRVCTCFKCRIQYRESYCATVPYRGL